MSGPQIPRGRDLDSQAKAFLAARAALEKQAEGVVVMEVRSLSTVTDFFVVCTAGSLRQLAALAEHIEAVLERHGCPVWHTEGAALAAGAAGRFPAEPQWVLMDCGDLIVHLFDEPTRALYRLEELWADAPRLSVNAVP